MANYFSLPLELRQQILIHAVEAAADYDDAVLQEIQEPRESQVLRINHSPHLKAYATMAIRASLDNRLSWQPKSAIQQLMSTLDLQWKVTNYPVVHKLVQNLLAVNAALAGDLVWVLDTWAADEAMADFLGSVFFERKKEVRRIIRALSSVESFRSDFQGT